MGDEEGKGIDARRCGYLRMRMIQRWTWSSRVRWRSKVVHWRVLGGGEVGTRRGVSLLFGGRGGVGSLYDDIVFGRVDVVYVLAVFGCMGVRVCFILSARYLPLPSWSCCALNQGMPSSSSKTNNTALGEGESRAYVGARLGYHFPLLRSNLCRLSLEGTSCIAD